MLEFPQHSRRKTAISQEQEWKNPRNFQNKREQTKNNRKPPVW